MKLRRSQRASRLPAEILQFFDRLRMSGLSMWDCRLLCLGLLLIRVASEDQDSGTAALRVPPLVVPPDARWEQLLHLKEPREAVMRVARALEAANPCLAGVLNGMTDVRTLLHYQPALPVLLQAVAELRIPETLLPDENPMAQLVNLLQTAFTESFRGLGAECSTPPEVSSLLVQLVRPRPGMSVYDPAAGSCRILVEASRYISTRGEAPTRLALHGTEINSNVWSEGRMNLWFNCLDGKDIRLGDALVDNECERLFDCIITDPPIGTIVRTHQSNKSQIESQSGHDASPVSLELAFVGHCLKRMKQDGVCAILVPASRLFQRSSQAVWRELLSTDVLDAVIAIPGRMSPHTTVRACILVLRRGRRMDRREKVLFIGLEQTISSASARLTPNEIDRIATTYESWSEHSGYSRAVHRDEIAANDYSLDLSRYLKGRDEWYITIPETAKVFQLSSPTKSEDYLLTSEQSVILLNLHAAIAKQGLINLVGPRGVGKTTILMRCAEELRRRGETVVALSAMYLRDIINRSMHGLSDEADTGSIIVDDLDPAVFDRNLVERFQMWLHTMLKENPGRSIVVASRAPLAELQEECGVSVFPRSTLADATILMLTGGPGVQPARLAKASELLRKASCVKGTSALIDRDVRTRAVAALEAFLDAGTDPGDGVRELLISSGAIVRSGNGELTVIHWLQSLLDSKWAVGVLGVEERSARNSALSDVLLCSAWENFLRQLVGRHSWLGEELVAAGLDLQRDDMNLAIYTFRVGQKPVEFVASLLRPSDVRKLFPDARGSDKHFALEAAIASWKEAGEKL